MSCVSLSRKVTVLMAFIAAVVAGFTVRSLWPTAAHAQMAAAPLTIYVPSEGVVFRTLEGKVIARLSQDGSGGVLELYDSSERPTFRLSGSAPVGLPAPRAEPSAYDAPIALGRADPYEDRF